MQLGTHHFIKILAYTGIVFLCTACNFILGIIQPENFDSTRDTRLKNGSSHKIQVKAYVQRKLLDAFVLDKNAEKVSIVTYALKDINKYNTANVFKFDTLTSGHRDSIIIIFDDKKQIIQTCERQLIYNCDDIPKNLDIIAKETNKWKKNRWSGKNKTVTSYSRVILTDEDFDRAVPIDK
jgi:tRNA(Leu) C34 or U34 (ribose-2'-O)-methylase TrmL